MTSRSIGRIVIEIDTKNYTLVSLGKRKSGDLIVRIKESLEHRKLKDQPRFLDRINDKAKIIEQRYSVHLSKKST